MNTLAGKIALVTGGNSGIGLATARLFAAEGARVVITGRRSEAVDEAVEQIGADAIGITGDVADLAHHTSVAARIKDEFGRLDIYMANAGVNLIRNSAEVSPEEFDMHFAINARGTFFGVQAMAPVLSTGGSVILTGSIASDHYLEGHAVYAGSKAAICAFARSWAIEFKARGIRVNVLSPGPTDTAILEKLGIEPQDRGAFEQAVAAAIPLGRLGMPSELASAALFLASKSSSFVSGVNLRVDGGMSLL